MSIPNSASSGLVEALIPALGSIVAVSALYGPFLCVYALSLHRFWSRRNNHRFSITFIISTTVQLIVSTFFWAQLIVTFVQILKIFGAPLEADSVEKAQSVAKLNEIKWVVFGLSYLIGDVTVALPVQEFVRYPWLLKAVLTMLLTASIGQLRIMPL
ncbi:hypothetical protein AURDEDRAFT_163782 [Auricularia subglabra TFB-10046 SS5]|nr:hypothetical protein AURDEDRAFT_163782 [Auricularia subglabra TFB-10046 SS5]